jgi:hypothetical protein
MAKTEEEIWKGFGVWIRSILFGVLFSWFAFKLASQYIEYLNNVEITKQLELKK